MRKKKRKNWTLHYNCNITLHFHIKHFLLRAEISCDITLHREALCFSATAHMQPATANPGRIISGCWHDCICVQLLDQKECLSLQVQQLTLDSNQQQQKNTVIQNQMRELQAERDQVQSWQTRIHLHNGHFLLYPGGKACYHRCYQCWCEAARRAASVFNSPVCLCGRWLLCASWIMRHYLIWTRIILLCPEGNCVLAYASSGIDF